MDKKQDNKKLVKDLAESVIQQIQSQQGSPKKIDNFIEKIFWVQNQGLFLHWQDMSGFKHEILGKFYKEMNEKIDELVESYLGVFSMEALYVSDSMYKVEMITTVQDYMKETQKIFDSFRNSIDGISGLTNVIDDILTIIERTKYLLLKS